MVGICDLGNHSGNAALRYYLMATKIISVTLENRYQQDELIDQLISELGRGNREDCYEDWESVLHEIPEYVEIYFEVDTDTLSTKRLGTYEQLTDEQKTRA
jgi:hypothetical protein